MGGAWKQGCCPETVPTLGHSRAFLLAEHSAAPTHGLSSACEDAQGIYVNFSPRESSRDPRMSLKEFRVPLPISQVLGTCWSCRWMERFYGWRSRTSCQMVRTEQNKGRAPFLESPAGLRPTCSAFIGGCAENVLGGAEHWVLNQQRAGQSGDLFRSDSSPAHASRPHSLHLGLVLWP